jgi:hypothetical protein
MRERPPMALSTIRPADGIGELPDKTAKNFQQGGPISMAAMPWLLFRVPVIHGIMERAAERGLARTQADAFPPPGVDEKAFRKGHKYLTLVNDVNRSRVRVRHR